MPSTSMYAPLLVLSSLLDIARGVTVYGLTGQTTIDPLATGTTTTSSTAATTSFVTTSGPPQYTGLAAYNPIYMIPPAIPDPAPANQFSVQVPSDVQHLNGVSIQIPGSFFGFSIEMSVANQLIGTSSANLHVPFLNFMSLLAERSGEVHVRVGGNTQEFAYMVDSLEDGKFLEKNKEDALNPTGTPVIAITPELIYMLGNVSSLVNVKWYLGIPFNDTNWRLQIAEVGQSVLGDKLLGLQASNEPDLYARHGHRPEEWGPQDFFNEFGSMNQAYTSDSQIPVKNNLIAPSVTSGWTPEMVWDTGFIDAYGQYLSALSVERYSSDNCAVVFPDPNNPPKDPLEMLPAYLSHKSGINIISQYLNSSMLAQQWGKPFMMFETNTASCGGFPGISDTFTSALWGVDYGLQMAHSNFSQALFHFGGQNVSYNPFTAAPTNESSFHQWTTGPIFYASVFVAEALGKTNTAQVKDLFTNDGNDLTPGYVIYENGKLARMALINYMTDQSGAHDYVATVNVGGADFGEGNGVPASVKVKYLRATSVSEKDDITWAGQTLGGRFQSDGRWSGEETIDTIQCDQGQNACSIKVPAPGAALVFFSDDAQNSAGGLPTATFPTTYVTKSKNTVSIDPSVLATSNGENGKNRAQRGGTSFGSANGAIAVVGPSAVALLSIVASIAFISRRSW
ncbi:glycoside hydrolase family 79 protein [Daedaleopsis nitida]|nr:glycoside hydrolase family 79 protein [Daedaleopsis nitida]